MPYKASKIYYDGSHYIAVPKENFPSRKGKKAVRKSNTQTDSVKTKFEAAYAESQALPKRERKQYIAEKLQEDFTTAEEAKEYTRRQTERKRNNACKRYTRLWRKVYLQGKWDYFVTFTYDNDKHTEESFRQSLRNTLKHLVNRKGWKYIGVWERSASKRLHFHGIFYIPENAMVGELKQVSDYSTKQHRMQTTYQNTHFSRRFGRNDFKAIGKNEVIESVRYLLKYIEKSGERLVYDGDLPTYFKSDITDEDIVCPTGVDGKRNSQARDWCFTINNPVQTEQEIMEYLQTVKDLRYVVFQRERVPETGTEHYQGYFEFTQPKWFSGIKKCLSKENIGVDAHIEARRGKRSQAREYCMDEETRISPQFYEYGEFIEDGERTDLTDIMHDIENGMSFYDLSKKHGNRFIRFMKWAKEYRQSHLENKFKRVFRNMKVYYIYGSAGCGKTSYVFQKHGYDDVYRTTNYEFGWIDDYNGEKILFLDESRSSFKISEILDYLDGQPIRIRGRHYNRVACYDTVYIVSNLSLKEQYTNIQQSEPKTWAAFCRRITAVYDFDKSKDIPVNKFTGELKKPPTLIEIADDGDMPF